MSAEGDVGASDLWEAKPINLDNPAHEAVIAAVGRVALASAQAENALRSAIYSTYHFGDDVFIFLEGEGSGWLLEKLRLACRAFYGPSADAFDLSYRQLKDLFGRRNRFVHGQLAATKDGRYVTFVSRRHKEIEPESCTAAEINELAREFGAATATMFRSISAARRNA